MLLAEFMPNLSVSDIDSAHRGADRLRSIINHNLAQSETLTLVVGGDTYEVKLEELTSLAKVAETVAKVQADAEDEEISPQDAAAILKMSRPSVMRLIEKRLLPAHKVHSHNRLSRADVIAYRDKQAEVRRHAMAELAAIAEEYDF